MNLQKIIWKIPITTPKIAEPDRFFKIFNTWIPDSPEIFVDVADYQHVTDGPLTVLVGHYVDYVLDLTDNELGLMYRRKRDLDGDNKAKINDTLHEALKGFHRMEQEREFSGKLKFDTSLLEFIVNDRAAAPNNKKTWETLKPDMENVLNKVFGTGKYSLNYDPDDPRTRFRLTISAKEKQELSKLIAK